MIHYYCILCNEVHKGDTSFTLFSTGFRAISSGEVFSVGICVQMAFLQQNSEDENMNECG
ncbi:DUF3973 domain-containing protein [Cohnella sp.]|uniref:DUF3973 domain-containing protein n=1 Tax=Cohnella sp. TaxID=1883426 RepID=UPI003565FC0C